MIHQRLILGKEKRDFILLDGKTMRVNGAMQDIFSDMIYSKGIKKAASRAASYFPIWRFRADSNRCTRFCRPLPSHSATEPYI